MKRFYKEVRVEIAAEGYGVTLDGKPVKTPAGRLLTSASPALAEYLAEEWRAQKNDILPLTMPVNQIVITAIDQTRSADEIIAHMLDFVDTDLLYYRSDQSPYKEKQEILWGKWIESFEKDFSVALKVTSNIESLTQDARISEIFKTYLERLSFIELILFETLVEDTSSPLLTMAFFTGKATKDDLYDAIFVDDMIRAEIYNEEQYGAAPDQEKKRNSIRLNLEAIANILSTR